MSNDAPDLKAHWDDRHLGTPSTEVSWYEEHPTVSVELIDRLLPGRPASIVDIGGGAGLLVDHLVAQGHDVSVVDISAAALESARARLSSAPVTWIVADVRTWVPPRLWDLWHDRAMLHFLTDPADRARYAATMRSAIGPGGAFVLGVFAEDGPTHCSGLEVHRYTSTDLRSLVGDAVIEVDRRAAHTTPAGVEQRFRWLAGRLC